MDAASAALGRGFRRHRVQEENGEHQRSDRKEPQKPEEIEEEQPRRRKARRCQQLRNDNGKTHRKEQQEVSGAEKWFATSALAFAGPEADKYDNEMVGREQKGGDTPRLARFEVGRAN